MKNEYAQGHSVGPTPEQDKKITELQQAGYKWDKQHSAAAAGVILKRDSDGDFWFFGMQGEIMHNPDGIKIPVDNSRPRLSHEKDIF